MRQRHTNEPGTGIHAAIGFFAAVPLTAILLGLVAVEDPVVLGTTLLVPFCLAIAAGQLGAVFRKASHWQTVFWGWKIGYSIAFLAGFIVGLRMSFDHDGAIWNAFVVAFWSLLAGSVTGLVSIGGPVWVAAVRYASFRLCTPCSKEPSEEGLQARSQ